MRSVRPIQVGFLLFLLLALAASGLAQAPASYLLTNADIVKMVKAGIPESIILREIQMSNSNFVTSSAALIDLKKRGASDRILGAILDSRGGPGSNSSQPMPLPPVPTSSAAPGPHRLPTFDADMRLNKTTHAKLSVRQNQIKLEGSGVPLFSLKWKEPHSP